MSLASVQTAWMWPVENSEPTGAVIDPEAGLLRWYDQVGCFCGDDESFVQQPLESFLANGVPGRIAEPPSEILAEIRQAAQQLLGREETRELCRRVV